MELTLQIGSEFRGQGHGEVTERPLTMKYSTLPVISSNIGIVENTLNTRQRNTIINLKVNKQAHYQLL